MKRVLLLAGLFAFLLPAPSLAADSTVCKAIKDMAPVSSHYVKKVLERADKGLEKARGSSAVTGLEIYFFSWAGRIGAAANSLIDSYLNLTVEEQDLLNTTACLRVDVLLLDCKIDETQKELQSQLEKKSIVGMIELESLLEFLQERKVHLVRGALNPDYEDPTWDSTWRFDDASSSSSSSAAGGGASSSSSQGMCPFDTDYAPPASDGYGCDTTVLNRIAAYKPAEKEKESLEKTEQELEKYKQTASEFGTLELELNALYENGGSTPEAAAPAGEKKGHEEISGCRDDEKPTPEDLRLRALRSPFSYKKNDLYILSEFLGKRAAEGMFREQEDELKNADEIEDEEKRAEFEESNNPFIEIFRESARSFYQSVSGAQGKKEARIFAAAPDSTLEIAEALGDLRKSVGELSRLSSEKEGIRRFVIRFAYFLRRSCVYRPCNESLERVLRTAYADECFPYTDGEFLKDSEGDQRWKKCAEAACIEAKGVTLPPNCKDVLPKKE